MKTKHSSFLAAVILLAAFVTARAQVTTNFYLDANGSTGGIGGTTNWTTSGTAWTTNPLGSSTTVSGNWVNGAAWSNSLANNAILQGTAGTVSLSSTTIYANQIQANTTGFTIQNSSTGTTSANRYFRTKNGIILADGVNLNVSSGVTTNGAITGLEGKIMGSNGTNGVSANSSITIVGATANADSSVRIGLDTSATDIYVPLYVNTTGSGYANIAISSSSVTSSIYGSIIVSNNSRLVLGGNNSSTSRRINVRGNLTTANTDLTIGEVGGGTTVVLYGSNSIGGNVVLQSGSLGYGTNTAFGTSTLVISNGTSFGQQGAIGATDLDRTITNSISLRGDATFGLGSYSSYLAGNVDLNGASRTIALGNSTYFSGSITNGSLIVSSASATRSLVLNGSNSFSAITQNGGTINLGNDNGLGAAVLTVQSNAVGNTLSATSGRSITNAISLAAGSSLNLDSGSSNAPTTTWNYGGVISGGGSIAKTGVGSLTLAGANTYSGTTTISQGTLTLGNASALSTGSVLVFGGVLDLNLLTLTNAISISGGTVTNGTIGTSGAFSVTDGTLATQIGGSGSLVKSGSGTVILAAANTYSGGTTVSAGTLTVNNSTGSGTGTGTLSVSNGATLNGSGIVGSATTVAGTHAPGNSPGVQTFTNGLTYVSGATFVWELAANTSTGRGISFDGVDVTGGTLSINTGVTNNLVFNSLGSSVIWSDAFWDTDQSWLVFSDASAPSLAVPGIFSTVSVGLDSLGGALTNTRTAATFAWTANGNDVYLNYTVPEPSTYALLAIAGAAFAGYSIRCRKRAGK